MRLRLVTPKTPSPPLHAYGTFRVVPLTRNLLDLALMISDQPQENALYGNEVAARNRLQPKLGIAMLDGDSLFCVGGIIPTRPGWAEAWAIFSPIATARQRAFACRVASRYLDAWAPSFRRIEWSTWADMPWRESFAQRMGYTEGWGPMKDPSGRSLWLYARVHV